MGVLTTRTPSQKKLSWHSPQPAVTPNTLILLYCGTKPQSRSGSILSFILMIKTQKIVGLAPFTEKQRLGLQPGFLLIPHNHHSDCGQIDNHFSDSSLTTSLSIFKLGIKQSTGLFYFSSKLSVYETHRRFPDLVHLHRHSRLLGACSGIAASRGLFRSMLQKFRLHFVQVILLELLRSSGQRAACRSASKPLLQSLDCWSQRQLGLRPYQMLPISLRFLSASALASSIFHHAVDFFVCET